MPPLQLPRVRSPEPKSINAFIKAGHPWMALILAMSWQWRGTISTLFLALVGYYKFSE